MQSNKWELHVTKYTAEFIGCRVNASGIQYAITDTFACEPSDLFRLLYDKYEHIRLLTLKVDGRLLSDMEQEGIYQSTNWSNHAKDDQAIPSNASSGGFDSEMA